MKTVDRTLDIHVILDSYATHKHPKVKAWLAKNPRVHFHFVATGSSWLNLIERFFGEPSQPQLKRLAVTSVDQSIEAIMAYINHGNVDPKPFVRTASVQHILGRRSRKRARLLRHYTRTPRLGEVKMPMITIMTWNIRTFSFNRALTGPTGYTATMVNSAARVIAAARTQTFPANPADVVLIVELRSGEAASAMCSLSTALRGPLMDAPWSGFLFSHETGFECYGLLIRDLDAVRVAYPAVGPAGTKEAPLRDLRESTFAVWPSPDWTTSAYPLPFPQGKPIPLVDVFANSARPSGGPVRFPGQPANLGGFRQGTGSRLPAMPILYIKGTAGRTYLVPIVVMHLAAVRGRSDNNALGRGQITRLPALHIAQLFNSPSGAGYLAVQTAAGVVTAEPVQELLFTGDFNLDFLQNPAGAAVNRRERLISAAYSNITPTQAGGGSGAPGAAPAAPSLPPPPVPYAAPFAPAPQIDAIPAQQLRTAITAQGTILGTPPAPPGPPIPPAPYVTAAFDNFFFGGTQLTTAPAQLGGDAGLAMDLPGLIKARQIDVAQLAAAYEERRGAPLAAATNLQGAGALSDNDARFGANLISDHLPVVLTFDCP